MAIERKAFEFVRDLVRDRAAIVLNDDKEYLVEARLKPVCTQQGFDTIEDLAEALRSKPRELVTLVVEALTTNETSFFRDLHPFETLEKHVLPRIIESRRATRELNLWCGASSSGQEPLTIAMVLREAFPELSAWKVRILATDINQEMIERCRSGIYSQLEVARGLPAKLLVKYFQKEGPRWRAKDEILGLISYQQMNLAKPFPRIPPMDIVFLRNVLIYFDSDMKAQILGNVRRVLRDDGMLFLGTAESTVGLANGFDSRAFEKTTCYQRAA